ncbi:aspartate aminotransferase family protein [Amorphus orientalis]|uniref:Adenosylmethionine-8-amino-7-oxononanoate aminotransferase n=1 Tax=Amorphus orientalis TaxID=649198 RepID=A0AAE4AU05_9HYPH|nr:aspartate aminotransferase family protein [Amorphus orientalis]MDQ0316815.1 adenosylmethionine-8-amino-7-oxononanoate aminotransferase [Amorphus orientalis]
MPSPHVFPRHTKAEMPVAVGGDGCYLIDETGKRYLDGCGGAAVSCLGHSDKAVVEAIKTQLDALPYAHTGFFTSKPAEALADRLADKAPEGLNRVYFVSGGSEAAEAALKLARQYFWEKGEKARANVIARWQSYHGNTLGALAAGGNRWRRAQFEPLLTDAMHHIDPCHYWRWGEPGESEEDYGRRVADQLEEKILELGPETVAAFMAEPVVGATMGAVPPVAGYFKRIREICDRYGVLLILDEVMCGMGRTGTLFACEQDGVVPDMILIAKGLGAGYQPIGATIVADHIYATLEQGSGFFQHGHTYIGHPTACAAGVAVLDQIESRDLLANVNRVGSYLKSALQERFGQHPNVGDVRGRGMFLGLELVADRDTKAPFDPSDKVAPSIKKAAMADGLMVYPMGGTIDGERGDHVLIAPPFILTEAQADELVDKLGRAMDAVLS